MGKRLVAFVLFTLSLSLFAQEREEITPPAGPFVKGGADVFITGEFLWWKGIQEGLSYATTGVLVESGTNVTSAGKVHKVDYSWNPGFRVGIGFYPGHDGWDLFARYTWYHSSATDSVSRPDGNMAPGTFSFDTLSNINVGGFTNAKSHWSLHYNIIDLELGRNFFLSRSLQTRLFAGLRGAWNHQDWKLHYLTNQIVFGDNDPLPGTMDVLQQQKTWGIGIRMGMNGTWTFYKGWSIVSDASVAGIWVDYNNHRKDTITQAETGSTVTTQLKSDPNSSLVNLELMLGLRGEWWFSEEAYHLSVQAGWENQIWINYGKFIYLFQNYSGDLTFSGLSAKLRFDF
ncbi:MAG: hypothetical protein H7A38_07020 [Chlamydiales bacterium]|nr:hypothetical protein [Chlamydiales bacterium]